MTASEVGNALAKHYDALHGLCVTNPYRLAMLFGCSTASRPDWRRAFGIMPYWATSQAARYSLGYQAFVGWATTNSDFLGGINTTNGTDLTSSTLLATAYTETLQCFFLDWMNGASLAQCIRDASNTNLVDCPLPVPEITTFTISGVCFTNTYPSKIYVVGHSGLTVTGLVPWDENKFVSPVDIEAPRR
jgi:hypothetical protein